MLRVNCSRGILAVDTGVQEVTEAGVGREEQDEVVERDGADEVEQEPGAHVASSDLVRLQDDLVRKIVRYDTCPTHTHTLKYHINWRHTAQNQPQP